MRVEAIGNRGTGLPAVVLEQAHLPTSRFNITVGAEYEVHAMMLIKGLLDILLVSDGGTPKWYPLALFTVTDHKVPDHWEFGPSTSTHPPEFFWGYPTLIREPYHHEDLTERKSHALDAFTEETGVWIAI